MDELEAEREERLEALRDKRWAAEEAMKRDAARYRWLRDQAYTLSSMHHNGRCAYEVQKEDVALWIKTKIKSDDASVDAAIDAAMQGANKY